MRKFLMIAIAILAIGCAEESTKPPDPPKPSVFQYTCTCWATCDGEYAENTEQVCETEEGIRDLVLDSVAQCQAELAAVCVDWSCDCECPDSTTLCN